jgi:hypothetical protein
MDRKEFVKWYRSFYNQVEIPKPHREMMLKKVGYDYKYLRITVVDVDTGEEVIEPLYTYRKSIDCDFESLVSDLWLAIRLDDDLLQSIKIQYEDPEDGTKKETTAKEIYRSRITSEGSPPGKRGMRESTKRKYFVLAVDYLSTAEVYEEDGERRISYKDFIESRINENEEDRKSYLRVDYTRLVEYVKGYIDGFPLSYREFEDLWNTIYKKISVKTLKNAFYWYQDEGIQWAKESVPK